MSRRWSDGTQATITASNWKPISPSTSPRSSSSHENILFRSLLFFLFFIKWQNWFFPVSGQIDSSTGEACLQVERRSQWDRLDRGQRVRAIKILERLSVVVLSLPESRKKHHQIMNSILIVIESLCSGIWFINNHFLSRSFLLGDEWWRWKKNSS